MNSPLRLLSCGCLCHIITPLAHYAHHVSIHLWKKMTKHKHQIVAKLIICYHQFHTITFTLLATSVKTLVDDWLKCFVHNEHDMLVLFQWNPLCSLIQLQQHKEVRFKPPFEFNKINNLIICSKGHWWIKKDFCMYAPHTPMSNMCFLSQHEFNMAGYQCT